MGSLNRVIIVGRLGADPELRFIASGKAVCGLRIATSETWKDKAGAKQEKTEWHRVTAWGPTAENAAKYLKKGSEVLVEGRLQTSQYEKNGEKRYSTDIQADRVVFLGGKGSGQEPSAHGAPAEDGFAAPGEGAAPASDDDVPF